MIKTRESLNKNWSVTTWEETNPGKKKAGARFSIWVTEGCFCSLVQRQYALTHVHRAFVSPSHWCWKVLCCKSPWSRRERRHSHKYIRWGQDAFWQNRKRSRKGSKRFFFYKKETHAKSAKGPNRLPTADSQVAKCPWPTISCSATSSTSWQWNRNSFFFL